jgi:hypothetical protein
MSPGVRATLVGACEGMERSRARKADEEAEEEGEEGKRRGLRKVWILPSDSACLLGIS